MTLTKFMARSSWVAHAFEWEKLLKCHLKGKASKKLANGQNIDYSEKRKRPKGFICPCTGVKYHNIQTCLLVYAADSGERLQDHWSSGIYKIHSCTVSPDKDKYLTPAPRLRRFLLQWSHLRPGKNLRLLFKPGVQRYTF